MNWQTYLSGTQWTHAAGFAILAVVLISTLSVSIARVARKRPTWKHGILLSALVACLLAAALGTITGIRPLSIIAVPVAIIPNIDAAAVTVGDNLVLDDPGLIGVKTHRADSRERPVAEPDHTSSTSVIKPGLGASDGALASLEYRRDFQIQWPIILAALWSFGTAWLLAFAFRSHRRGWLIRHWATPLNVARLQACSTVARDRVRLKKMPAILQTAEVASPVVHGCRKPVVLLPMAMLDSVSNDELTDILVHEFAHVVRRDTMVIAAETFARALFWPIITVHLMIRELGRAREEVCDNFVLSYRDPITYAGTLLKIAQSLKPSRIVIPSVGVLHWRGRFETRVAAILDPQRSHSHHLSLPIFILVASLFVAASIVISGTRLVATERPSTIETTEKKETNAKAVESKPVQSTRVITVRGTTKNLEGNPIAYAKVHLISLHTPRQQIAVTTSDETGNFVFEDAVMPVRPATGVGSLNVFGFAEGYGFIWHGLQHVAPGERPEHEAKGPYDNNFFNGEEIRMDLNFPLERKLFGRVLDDQNAPVVGAEVSINHLDYLYTEGRAMRVIEREFFGLKLLPKSKRVVQTDANGNFTFTGLPKDTVAWVQLTHDDYAVQKRYVAITDQAISQYKYVINSGITVRDGKDVRFPIFKTQAVSMSPIVFRVVANESVSIRIIDDQNAPLADALIFATSGDRGTGTSIYQKTDAEGVARLALPPGEYRLSIDPVKLTEFVPFKHSLTIHADNDNQPMNITAPRGAVLIFKAIDADTGNPIAGVSFWCELDESGGSHSVQSWPGYGNDPVTDRNGELRIVVNPGTREYGVDELEMPTGYRCELPVRNIDCRSGSTLRVTFELQQE
ncbi:M56 family metallopeptidase [Allorhodopirellula solitaria]|uniref:Methicillin resistance mecR1 protein n=1 Tax=Allorhodopirellula solitaria TaxID=2527987 RepID=A0A5C5WXI8_9BACT|nr:M56 family metallopeptidase [Allorhodopirellula solitaria]TWT55674.1 Methicillin resistance mecR1 protein [Allorhodopirellula solitaria]